MPYRRHPTNHVTGATEQQQPSYEEWIEGLRDAKWLVAWQRRNNFSDEQAAEVLALSVSGYRKQRSGRAVVSRQTAKLALLSPIDPLRMIDIAQLAMTVARMNVNRR
jgi:hypothetical protein